MKYELGTTKISLNRAGATTGIHSSMPTNRQQVKGASAWRFGRIWVDAARSSKLSLKP